MNQELVGLQSRSGIFGGNFRKKTNVIAGEANRGTRSRQGQSQRIVSFASIGYGALEVGRGEVEPKWVTSSEFFERLDGFSGRHVPGAMVVRRGPP